MSVIKLTVILIIVDFVDKNCSGCSNIIDKNSNKNNFAMMELSSSNGPMQKPFCANTRTDREDKKCKDHSVRIMEELGVNYTGKGDVLFGTRPSISLYIKW